MVEVVDMDTEETRLIADTGMVVVRYQGAAGLHLGCLHLGLSRESDADKAPDVEIRLTRKQVERLLEELAFYRTKI